jgi:hypothetical protein
MPHLPDTNIVPKDPTRVYMAFKPAIFKGRIFQEEWFGKSGWNISEGIRNITLLDLTHFNMINVVVV